MIPYDSLNSRVCSVFEQNSNFRVALYKTDEILPNKGDLWDVITWIWTNGKQFFLSPEVWMMTTDDDDDGGAEGTRGDKQESAAALIWHID